MVKFLTFRDDAILVIDKNKFIPSNEAFIVDSDTHNLKVTIKHLNETVLEVQYLNPHTIQINGHFRYKGKELLVAKDKTVMPDGGTIIGGCDYVTTSIKNALYMID